MKLSILSTTLITALAFATPQYAQLAVGDWSPAGPDDFRGPCPMMNTLANHGFLNRDGKNLTQDVVVNGLSAGLNFNTSLATIMFTQALPANPEPNATFFTLDQLNRHNVLEHDASLSRSDAYFGNNHVFNQSIFDTSKVYFTEPTITAAMLANAKVFRQIQSKSFNPNYTFTATMEQFSLGEMAAPIVAFGDKHAATANRTLVEYFFENERLPTELGWNRPTDVIQLEDIAALTTVIGNATSLITTSKPIVLGRRSNLHWGF
ncbi:sterigmatocystin biosynthesis peroxidase stcc protein [Rutstroemia sp. NJR-2017a BVV2]|nr:sterigmatocystin biosynthesis peroxidase stcc protein [Rutstroemia sp. NJR-2017a BVV2]